MNMEFSDIDKLDFDDDELFGSDIDGNNSAPAEPFDPDTYVKPWIGVDGNPEPDIKDNPLPPTIVNEEDEDIIVDLLKAKGIQDISAIKWENEDGIVEERDFNSLSRQEQLEILNSFDEQADETDLSDSEIDVINAWREYDLSPEQYIDYLKQQAVEEYLRQQELNVEEHPIDTLSDDELYILDLQDSYPNLTDEELIAALSHEKTNTVLFEKKMEALRTSYKEREAERLQEEELLQREEEARQLQEFTSTIQDAVGGLDKIGEFILEDDDKEQVAEFILGVDKTGQRYFARALNDPDTLARMAWFALVGDEALDSLSGHYKQEIEKRTQAAYNKGLEDAKKGITTQQKPNKTVVVKQPAQTQKGAIGINDRTFSDIDYIDVE